MGGEDGNDEERSVDKSNCYEPQHTRSCWRYDEGCLLATYSITEKAEPTRGHGSICAQELID